ncbi:hypothetical protein [Actinoplanes sp. GCM10030250]|uniref:hypothetical protein n=1 Tax=Actinoplanes sp. GCM10030250 TaxID=3273376 RepID=UPI00361998A3
MSSAVSSAETVFLVRAALTVADLSEPDPAPAPIVDAIRSNAGAGDGYAAVELLGHSVYQRLKPAIVDESHARVAAVSLGTAPTGDLADDLASSAEDSLLTITRHVAGKPGQEVWQRIPFRRPTCLRDAPDYLRGGQDEQRRGHPRTRYPAESRNEYRMRREAFTSRVPYFGSFALLARPPRVTVVTVHVA